MPDELRLWEPLAGRLVRDALAGARRQLRAEARLAARLVSAALAAAIGPPPSSTVAAGELQQPQDAVATAEATTTPTRRHPRAPPWSLLPACCAVV
ncbi:uncharacterized protein LOC144107730 [Amblyomma americanum]|uniref:Uncharacterized protein n=1 Tax=Amblyomma americanum TaxID=6943 RepID=A0AAQ4DJ22_AMBAM